MLGTCGRSGHAWLFYARVFHDTGPGIAERFGSIVRLTRLGVLADFGRNDELGEGWTSKWSSALPSSRRPSPLPPRLPGRAGRSSWPVELAGRAGRAGWPGELLAGHLANPGRQGVNPGF
ncbi:MAG: hypothetical protein ABW215_10820 [Kibdelosporangium sp.]